MNKKLPFSGEKLLHMRHIHKALVVLALLLTAAGCAVGPDFKQPAYKNACGLVRP